MNTSGNRDALLSERILDSMRDGVIAIDLNGRVITFNEAAGTILLKNPADVIGQPFAAEFMADERYDDFNEVVLRAVYEAEVVHSTDVKLYTGKSHRDLRVSSSFLTHIGEDGARERFGVVVVFSDITDGRKRQKLQRLFGEYVDPRIVEQILSRGEQESSSRQDMTISFVDMRDYTGWSERLDADALTDVLNRFLTAVTKPIGEGGGITDKYIGDAAMAYWGPPFVEAGTHATDGCRAALGQIAAVDTLRGELIAEGIPSAERFDAVVGVATGDVLAGDIGPPSSRNFTVIGNAVNLAARLQDLAKIYGERIIASHETRSRAGDEFAFRELDQITVRGSHRPVRIHALTGRSSELSDKDATLAHRYEDALAHLYEGAFEPAKAAFGALAGAYPDDKATQLMFARATFLAEQPPPTWDGVWRGDAEGLALSP
ncbi:MAG: adenylate/guanylate cyclase domain-containing protein [Pseudomonadota bacterium]